jgi:hypothetical protein
MRKALPKKCVPTKDEKFAELEQGLQILGVQMSRPLQWMKVLERENGALKEENAILKIKKKSEVLAN